MQKVLVIGEGFVGKAIIQELRRGDYEVFSVNRTHLSHKYNEAEFLNKIYTVMLGHQPDIVINGIGHFAFSPTTETVPPKKTFDEIFDVNVKLAWRIARGFYSTAKFGEEKKYLIHLGSESAFIPHSRSALYCASKAALTMLTKNLARDWQDKICVFQVDPGVIRDSGMAKFIGYEDSDYLVTVETVAKLVRNLLELGPYTSGHSYPIGTIIR